METYGLVPRSIQVVDKNNRLHDMDLSEIERKYGLKVVKVELTQKKHVI